MLSTIGPTARQARRILIGTALLLTLGMGMRQSFGLFLGPITHDLALTASDFTLALAIQNIVWVCVPKTPSGDDLGFRR